MSLISSSGGTRKYTPIIQKLLKEAQCKVMCIATDIPTIMAGVKKEKVKWVKKKLWPKDKALKIDVEENGLTFRMVTDTSINNL